MDVPVDGRPTLNGFQSRSQQRSSGLQTQTDLGGASPLALLDKNFHIRRPPHDGVWLGERNVADTGLEAVGLLLSE
jgi:hypothetical protein